MNDTEEAMSAIFAERLKQAREERGMTQRALGLVAGQIVGRSKPMSMA